MLASKCDVCGEYFDNNESRIPSNNEKKLKVVTAVRTGGEAVSFNKVKMVRRYNEDRTYIDTIEYDVCPECMNKIAGLFTWVPDEEGQETKEKKKVRISEIYKQLLERKK